EHLGPTPGRAVAGPAPCRLAVARECTEYLVHEQQVRGAVARSGFTEPEVMGPGPRHLRPRTGPARDRCRADGDSTHPPGRRPLTPTAATSDEPTPHRPRGAMSSPISRRAQHTRSRRSS